jgi:hypothetical protein
MLLFFPHSLCALKRVAAKAEHARFGATQGIRIAMKPACSAPRRRMGAVPSSWSRIAGLCREACPFYMVGWRGDFFARRDAVN